ncbi:hypothetical protein AB0E77_00755 [Streptomyces sp. NPDC032940]|uniref:hypothetical protein n=1 Tax=Streptomyces sp. NPDC032940 TaxID=3155366 RepID=UPI0033F6AFFB
MTGTDGKDLQAEGLDLITQGITLTLEELRELGMVGQAGAGRGFSDIALSGLVVGHEGLTSAFTSFCERWEWGVRALVAEGNDFAAGVGLAAGTLYETDQYVEGTLKIATNSLVGNPYATEEEITGKSWSQLGDDTVDAYLHPDYSKESFEQAWANSKQGWMDAGRDVMTSNAPMLPGLSPEELRHRAGISDEQYEKALDDTFGPSPEERAQAAAPPPQPEQTQRHWQERQGGSAG